MRERAPPLIPGEIAEPVAGAIVPAGPDGGVALAFPAVALAGSCGSALSVRADGVRGCGEEEEEGEGGADGDAGDGAAGEARGAVQGVFEGVEL